MAHKKSNLLYLLSPSAKVLDELASELILSIIGEFGTLGGSRHSSEPAHKPYIDMVCLESTATKSPRKSPVA